MSVHECIRPLLVDVELIGCIIYIPLADSGRAAANLGEFQAPGASEPFHVCGGSADTKQTIPIACHLPYFPVSLRLNTVGCDHLRRDPSLTHGLQHVWIVVCDKFMGDLALNCQGIQVTFVTFDKFLDSDFHTICDTGLYNYVFKFRYIADLPGCGGTGPVSGLDD